MRRPTPEYAAARDRVEADEEMRELADIILDTDWTEGDEHWRWVAEAPREDILSWARAIDQDRSE